MTVSPNITSKGNNEMTLGQQPTSGQHNAEHQAGVVKTALTVAGASAAGFTTIIGAAAWDVIPVSLAYLGVSTFGLVMLVALAIVWIYLRR